MRARLFILLLYLSICVSALLCSLFIYRYTYDMPKKHSLKGKTFENWSVWRAMSVVYIYCIYTTHRILWTACQIKLSISGFSCVTATGTLRSRSTLFNSFTKPKREKTKHFDLFATRVTVRLLQSSFSILGWFFLLSFIIAITEFKIREQHMTVTFLNFLNIFFLAICPDYFEQEKNVILICCFPCMFQNKLANTNLL